MAPHTINGLNSRLFLKGKAPQGAPLYSARMTDQAVSGLDQSAGITGAKNAPDHKIQVMKKVQIAFAVWEIQ